MEGDSLREGRQQRTFTQVKEALQRLGIILPVDYISAGPGEKTWDSMVVVQEVESDDRQRYGCVMCMVAGTQVLLDRQISIGKDEFGVSASLIIADDGKVESYFLGIELGKKIATVNLHPDGSIDCVGGEEDDDGYQKPDGVLFTRFPVFPNVQVLFQELLDGQLDLSDGESVIPLCLKEHAKIVKETC